MGRHEEDRGEELATNGTQGPSPVPTGSDLVVILGALVSAVSATVLEESSTRIAFAGLYTIVVCFWIFARVRGKSD